jgi:PAS domain S-box-containing protein
VLAVPLVIGLQFAMTPLIGKGVPYISLFMVTTGVAVLAGMGPAILTSVLSAFLTDYFFIPPLHTFDLAPNFCAQLGVIILTSAYIGYVGNSLRKARENAEKRAGLLHESEAKYRELVENCGFMVVTYSCDGRVLYVNSMGEQYLGRKAGDVIGKHVMEAFGPEIGGKIMERLKHAAETGQTEDAIDHVMTPSGPRWMWGHPSINPGEDGKPYSVTVFLHDITEQKNAEMKLHESQQSLRHIVESSGLATAIYGVDCRVLYMNSHLLRMLGRAEEEVIGRHVNDVFSPEAGKLVCERINAVAKSGEASQVVNFIPFPSGARWILSWPSIIRDADGRITGITVFGYDITEQKMAEIKLKESEEQYKEFIENCGFIAISYDMNGRAIYANDKCIESFGCRRENVIGKYPTEYMGPENGAIAMKNISDLVASGRAVAVENMLMKPDGPRWFLSHPNLVRDENGNPKSVTILIEDITELKLVQEKLEESQERQRIMAEAVFQGIFIHDDGVLIEANKRFYDMVGYTAQELIGKQILPLILTEEAQKIIVQNMRKSPSDIVRVAAVRKDGTLFPVEVAGRDIIHNGRRVRVAVAVDLSERIRAQEELHESQERYRQLIETAGISITCFDENLRITLVNSVSAVRYQRQPEEIIGKRLSEIMASPWCDTIEANIRKVLESGRVSELEVELMFPVGHRWFWSRACPFYDFSGKVIGVTVFAHDITEQKLAQIALYESEHGRRTLTEMVMEGIFMHEDGVLLEANPRYFEMFGYKPEELLGKQARCITLTPESLQMAMDNVYKSEGKRIQVTGVRKDGSQFPCEIYGADAVYKGRNVRIAVAMDISDRINAEAELAQIRERMEVAERLAAVGYMGATMAHEINTPLSVMKLASQMLIGDLEKGKADKVNKDQAQTILNEIDHASEIVRNYRDMSRPSHDVGNRASDILEAMDGVINLLRKTAERAKLQLIIGPEVPDLLVWLGSVNSVEQLLLILTENAIQAADGQTWRKLEITGSLKDGGVEIRFTDNCCGIPPENLRKIFEPFFSTKPRNIGTGLGLSIVRRLLQERGGQIKVESKVTEGTTFIVTYPA